VEHEGFLRDICEHPDDDTPRLVYADWLEEQGDPVGAARAEFIHLQIELARKTPEPSRRREQSFRVRELLDQHRENWLEPLARFQLRDAHFVRGFVEKATLMAADLEQHAANLFQTVPLRRLWVTDTLGGLQGLAVIPADNSLSGLDLCFNSVNAAGLQQLAALSNLGRLRVLGLMFNELDDEAARLLCELPFFERLSLIRCAGNPLSEDARRRLRDHFGPLVSFVAERDEDHLYTIQHDRLTAGFGNDFSQLLLYWLRSEAQLVVFDHEGNLLGTATRQLEDPENPSPSLQDLPMDTREAWLAACDAGWEEAEKVWLKELGHRPATIRVKQFRFEGDKGIHAFPEGWTEILSSPNHPEREEVREWLEHWLKKGKFVYYLSDRYGDCWLNGEGVVTDT
jgi:uncharacterized protein (TIGR02996 family)